MLITCCRKIAIPSVLIVALIGCDDIKAKFHMLPNQDEQECLNSERLKFKDPDVLFVANLGSRGLKSVPNQYWVRYKAKNSYGAYLQGNMICKLDASTKKWVRDENAEYLLELSVTTTLLERVNAKMKTDPAFAKVYFSDHGSRGLDHETTNAKELLFTSPDDLTRYVEDEAKRDKSQTPPINK